jgi:hypothetical protein
VIARRIAFALYWLAITTAAAVASLAAAIPFTGLASQEMGLTAAGGVCLIGIACAPALNPRKDGRP